MGLFGAVAASAATHLSDLHKKTGKWVRFKDARREPTWEDFEDTLNGSSLKLSGVQLELAKILIEYRKKHFTMGHRSGRTTVVALVQRYFEACKFPKAGIEHDD